MSNDTTAITFRLSEKLRERIKAQAAAEERSESGFIRFHLGEMFKMSEEESKIDDEEPTNSPNPDPTEP